MKYVAAMNEQIFSPAEWLSSGIKFAEEEKPHQQLDRLDCFFSMEKYLNTKMASSKPVLGINREIDLQ